MSTSEGTIARVVIIMQTLCEAPHPLGVTEVSRATKLPMSTSHRLLDLLAEHGIIERISSIRKYTIGKEFLRLAGLAALRNPLATSIQPILDELTNATSETSVLAVFHPIQRKMSYLAKCDSPLNLRFRVSLNETFEPLSTAAGFSIYASLPDESRAELMSSAQIRKAGMSVSDFAARVAAARQNGYVISQGEQVS